MNQLANIVRAEAPSTGIQFRASAYGPGHIREFLRDVIAMANAPVHGVRYIIVGAEIDDRGMRKYEDVGDSEFSGKANCETLVQTYCEPAIRIRYETVQIEGRRVGVYEIGDCQERPYMLRVDFSETLRRGDAYVRAKDKAMKMGRRQLQALFEQNFKDSAASNILEIGFAGEIIHKDKNFAVASLEGLPSQVAVAKLEELLRVKTEVDAQGSTSVLARLTHARLFGPDDPYEDRSREQLLKEMREVKAQYSNHDSHFLYEQNGQQMQLVVFNQGEEDIFDATVSIVLPNQDGFYVAESLPPTVRGGDYVPPSEIAQSGYPKVKTSGGAVQVSCKIDEIPAGDQVEIFASPLRICAGPALAGKRFALQYSLFSPQLKVPARGRLRLMFKQR